jgi:hypothetical protein
VSYRFEYERQRYGDVELSRKSYVLLHEAQRVILADLDEWNRRARHIGADRDPYQEAAEHYRRAMAWGDDELRDPHARRITVSGMSIGGARHDRAALEYAALRAELEAERAQAARVPSELRKALTDRATAFRAVAAELAVEPAGILQELANSLRALERGSTGG